MKDYDTLTSTLSVMNQRVDELLAILTEPKNLKKNDVNRRINPIKDEPKRLGSYRIKTDTNNLIFVRIDVKQESEL